ncbi:MAG TPA: hypothetical protein VJ397_08785 [Thermoplasmata archaeon]|nr:hypothetical protein [Thermoplasmata archaeon]
MHADSGVRLKIVKAQLLERAFEPNEEANFRVTVRNLGARDAEEVVGVVASPNDKVKVLTEVLRFGNIAKGQEASAVLEVRSENVKPGRYAIKVVLSAIGVTATTDSFLVDIVEG